MYKKMVQNFAKTDFSEDTEEGRKKIAAIDD